MTAMAISQPGKKTFLFRAGLLAALTILGGCASMDKAVSDTQKLYAERIKEGLKL